jgi:hypothetical protein
LAREVICVKLICEPLIYQPRSFAYSQGLKKTTLALKIKRSAGMAEIIDVRGLDEKDVRLLESLAERLREKGEKKKVQEENMEQELVFATHRSNVIGKLTRREIYEDL